jgi:pyruvate dehydrogenase E2 component (dihydrolipoamide acetyltransferase)
LTDEGRRQAVRGTICRLCRDRLLAQIDLEGGTLTITNLGMFGVEEFAVIISPPQAAIPAVGAGRQEPVASDNGTLSTATVMRVVLSVDHRAVDGADAARWMSEFTKADAPAPLASRLRAPSRLEALMT